MVALNKTHHFDNDNGDDTDFVATDGKVGLFRVEPM